MAPHCVNSDRMPGHVKPNSLCVQCDSLRKYLDMLSKQLHNMAKEIIIYHLCKMPVELVSCSKGNEPRTSHYSLHNISLAVLAELQGYLISSVIWS